MNSKRLSLFLLYSILITGVFYGLGLSVKSLILPPSFIAPIWPSAGFAIGVIALWGKKYLPAILLGEIFISLSFYQFDELSDKPQLLVTYGLLLVSSAIRSLLGAYLVNKYLGRSNNYLTLEAVSKLLIYAGLISTFISSFISVVALLLSGLIEQDLVLINFLAWWFGDSLGVFLILPIMFLFFKKPRDVWKPRLFKTFIPVTITFSLLLIVAHNFKVLEHKRLKNILENNIEDISNNVLTHFKQNNSEELSLSKEQVIFKINEIFVNDTSDLALLSNLDDVRFVVYSNDNDNENIDKNKLFESKDALTMSQDWTTTNKFKYSDHEWEIVVSPNTDFFFNNASWVVWWLLSIGFLFISILGAGLLVITGSHLIIKDLVINKTAEINKLYGILKISEHKYKQLIEIQPVIFWRYIVGDSKIDYISKEAVNILGYSKKDLFNIDIILDKIFYHEDRNRVLQEYYEGINSNKSFVLKYRAVTKCGKILWFKDYVSTRLVDDRLEVIGLKLDITEEQEKNQQISQLAFFDTMTKLPNRVKFMEHLQIAITKSIENDLHGAVLYLDLNRFKVLNDSLGHHFGDKLLILVSKRLKKILRKSDIVARFGSDEFVILLGDKNKSAKQLEANVLKVTRKVNEAIELPFRIDQHNVYTSLSIGISLFPNNSANTNEIIQQADTAMYVSKHRENKSVNFFVNQMKKSANERLHIEKSLKIALQRDQFEMYYQPIFDPNKKIIRYESLIRWNHPIEGLKTPSTFIQIAEETGFIIELSEWIINNVFELIHDFNKSNIEILPISINISLIQFRDKKILGMLNALSIKYGIDNSKITLELTESIGIDDFEDTLVKIKKLKMMGFIIAIDDFGTGYSSLNYLTKMPIDILKLDQSFVRKIGQGTHADALVETIVSMAKHLDLDMVVEGVETEEQFEFLKNLGCSKFQGFLMEKAIPASELYSVS